tara:strand:+ start:1730 stop:2767 length:1038 start_codon:yes stop_codon:yes gene_type:complete
LKILITGGSGFIGSALVRESIKRGMSVLNYDALTYASSKESLSSVTGETLYSFVQGDIKDRAKLDQLFINFAPDAVINVAAETHVDRSIDHPEIFIETNILGTFSLLQAAYKYWMDREKPSTFRFLQISTDEVYGSLGASGSFSEITPYAPSSPYSASKASSDHLVRAWGETYGLPILITNCSNNYGPFQFPEKLIPVVINKALSGDAIPIYGTGQNIRDWLYVEDHVDALLTVLLNGLPNRHYNIGGNSEESNINIVNSICNILDGVMPAQQSYKDQISFVVDRPGHDLRYAVNFSRLNKELGWTPKHTLRDGLEKTVNWYLANQDWWHALLAQANNGDRQGKI